MDLFILLKLLCCALLLAKASHADSCLSAKCSLLSPEILSPFRIHDLHPNHCGLPQFDLLCKENRTIIHFPTYGDLVVKSISYGTRRLNLLDPKNCVHEVFLNLNLSLTPFSYYYVLRDYKYINCSSKLVGSVERVPCLSGSNHHVYVVEPCFSVPISCSFVKIVAIPFPYSPYLSDNSFGLGLTWNSTRLDEEETELECNRGIPCERVHPEIYLGVTGIIVFIAVIGKLMYASIPKKSTDFDEEEDEKKTLGEDEIDRSLGEYKALIPPKVVGAR